MKREVHNIAPVYDKYSKVLILGSFPSVRSREQEFFYAHPQNRFWKVIAALCCCDTPTNIPDKKKLLLENGIALWDVIESCEIKGSSDTSITNVKVNNIRHILDSCDIRAIFCNGGKSFELYNKYLYDETMIKAAKLPSTSPANAVCRLEKLINEWGIIKEYILTDS